jgi:hypothetical protein
MYRRKSEVTEVGPVQSVIVNILHLFRHFTTHNSFNLCYWLIRSAINRRHRAWSLIPGAYNSAIHRQQTRSVGALTTHSVGTQRGRPGGNDQLCENLAAAHRITACGPTRDMRIQICRSPVRCPCRCPRAVW